MVFPEGTRSRTGRINIEAATYGIGKILRKVPGCAVVCVYARGSTQESYSVFPNVGDSIHFEMDVLYPKTEAKGLRAIRDYSVQTIGKLKELEERYFAIKTLPSTTDSSTPLMRA